MKIFASLACSVAIFVTVATAASIPRPFQRFPITPRYLNNTRVQRELGSLVSNTTVFFGPDDSRYAAATARWNDGARPHIKLVVEAGQESDVSTIVRYCNENSIEFLAINGGHGHSESLGSFNGIQISLAQLRSITIEPDHKSAWFGGGVIGGQVTRYLWDRGFVTTTGSCDCVGLLGAGLGGGHGRHEGLYGLVSDNFLNLNVVLADGRAIRVNATSNADLLWAMKGAGHNFGIVTSFEMNVFPRGPDTWHYHNYIWRGEKLEEVFTALNDLHDNGNTPVNMALNFGNFIMNTTITQEEPIIYWFFAYRGTAEMAAPYLAPFNAIEAVYDESGDVPYPRISKAQQTAADDPLCGDGLVRALSTSFLRVYNVTTTRQIFDGFKRRVVSHPALAAGSNIVHEGYSTAAVDAQNPDDSAYPFRADHHLNLFNAVVPPGNSSLFQVAREWAKEVEDQWNAGEPGRTPSIYVNYANGLEPVEQIYGQEPWRLERLRGLKAKYDPYNRFRYFNPIIRRRGYY